MLRLAHRILTQPLRLLSKRPGATSPHPRIEAGLKRHIGEAVVIMANNIAALAASDPEKKWNPNRDFPRLIPPFDVTFIEYDQPCKGIEQCGALVLKCPNAQIQGGVWPVNAAHVSNFYMFTAIAGRVGVLDGQFQVACDDAGAIVGFIDAQKMWAAPFIPVCLTISLMHCKNVVRNDVTDSEGPSAKWLRNQKAPEIRYHVLDINPMKEVLRREGDIENNGLKKALHICRGHFATYTEEKPLFGRVAGTFWVPSHVRGSVEHGIVDKDYRVKAPMPERS